MAREIYTNKELMGAIKVITEEESRRYSDIPRWKGGYLAEAPSGKAVLLYFPDNKPPMQDVWFPLSQLRKAEDDASIYASDWFLSEAGF